MAESEKMIAFVPRPADVEYLESLKASTGLGRSEIMRRILSYVRDAGLTFAVEVKAEKEVSNAD